MWKILTENKITIDKEFYDQSTYLTLSHAAGG